MKSHDVVLSLLTISALFGCVSVHAESEAINEPAEKIYSSICALVKKSPLIEGMNAQVVATYKTDKSHYAYLLDSGCGKDGVINVGDMEPISELTTKEFYAAIDRRCAESGTPYLCISEAQIKADIKITKNSEGKLVAELLKVHEFSFINTP